MILEKVAAGCSESDAGIVGYSRLWKETGRQTYPNETHARQDMLKDLAAFLYRTFSEYTLRDGTCCVQLDKTDSRTIKPNCFHNVPFALVRASA